MSFPAQARAPAKVNLYLHVGPPWPNGRHPLDSLVVFAGSEAADVLAFQDADAFSLQLTGPGAADCGPETDNLVARAHDALSAETGAAPDVAVTLEKRLPVAAGLGGGSADAGALLRALGPACGVSPPALLALAARLGGDVPAATLSTPCLMRGDGDMVTPVSGLAPLPAVLAHAGQACPTAPVFQRYDALGPLALELVQPPAFETAVEMIDWLNLETRNDLEAAARALVPEIGETLSALAASPGARMARMSGSGAACFALFETRQAAMDGAEALARAQPDWWVRATLLGAGV